MFDNNISLIDENLTHGLLCPEATDTELYWLLYANWLLNGCIQLVLCLAGTLGNVAAIFLLTRPQIRTTFFNQLLTVLATWDLVYIVTMMLDAVEKLSPPDLETIPHYTVVFPVVLYPLQNITMTGSIFTTVGVTLERFLATHKPIYYNSVIKDVSGHTKRLVQYSLTIFILSVLFNVPKFLEGEVVRSDEDPDLVWVVATEFRTDPLYNILYHCWAQLVILGLLPFTLVSFMNVRIYLAITRLRRKNEKQEVCLCVILVTIVLTFFVCNLPRLLLNVHETFNLETITLCGDTLLGGFPVWSIYLGYISQVLMVINSSANFYIYCIIGANNREQFNLNVCCK